MSTKVVTHPVSGQQQSSSHGEKVQQAQSWEGRIVTDEPQEKAKLLAPLRSQLETRVKDGIATPLFLRHTLSLENGLGMRLDDPLKINLDFLKSRRNELAGSEPNDPQLIGELDEMIQELEQALELQLLKLANQSGNNPALVGNPAEHLLKKEADHIVQAVKTGKSRLLPCSFNSNEEDGRHAVGIRFSQGKDPDTVICSIFNSGAGIRQWHNWPGFTGKYDPEYTVRIPKSELSSDLIHPLLLGSMELNSAYQIFTDIPGAKVLDAQEKEAEGRPVREQQAQKGRNCSTEWIWSYIKCQIQGENRVEKYKMIREPFIERTFEAAVRNFDKSAPSLKNPYATTLSGGKDLDVLRNRMIKKLGKVEADKYPDKLYFDSEYYYLEFPEVIEKIDQQIITFVENNNLFKSLISRDYTREEAWKELFGDSQFYKRMEREKKFQ